MNTIISKLFYPNFSQDGVVTRAEKCIMWLTKFYITHFLSSLILFPFCSFSSFFFNFLCSAPCLQGHLSSDVHDRGNLPFVGLLRLLRTVLGLDLRSWGVDAVLLQRGLSKIAFGIMHHSFKVPYWPGFVLQIFRAVRKPTLNVIISTAQLYSTPPKHVASYQKLAQRPIQLLEYSKTSPAPSPPSRSGDPPSISGTECGIIDPLVSKRPGKNLK